MAARPIHIISVLSYRIFFSIIPDSLRRLRLGWQEVLFWLKMMALVIGSASNAKAKVEPVSLAPDPSTSQVRLEQAHFFIGEFQVAGARNLSRSEIETAIYPFLGPERTEDDVKAACLALEKIYRGKGFGTALVQYDSQIGKGGVVTLRVLEGSVARLRVKGARYFSPIDVKAGAPSLQEGKAINFNDVNNDILALNQLPDRRVVPAVRSGIEPGTFDVDLEVKDNAPVHASVEVNNRNTANTKPLRVNATLSDTNMGQTGDAFGVSYQVAPQRRDDSEVISGYYLARFAGLQRTTVMIQGTKQNSDISTLGGTTVAGPGQTLELRTNITLPNGKDWSTGKDWVDFSHTISLGFSYKHYKQTITTPGSSETAGASKIITPITYYPFGVDYSATWLNLAGENSITELNVGVNFNLRGVGSSPSEFDLNRYNSDGSYIYLRADFSHTMDIFCGLQVFGKISGQISNQPLVSSEQFSGGGLDTVRGYMEAQAVGDDGVCGTLELRSPSLFSVFRKPASAAQETQPTIEAQDAKKPDAELPREWRFHVFSDAGGLVLHDSLPSQKCRFGMVSVGAGTRLSWSDFISASLDAGYPIYTLGHTKAQDWRLIFRAGLNY